MKPRLLKYLCCPECKGEFNLTVSKKVGTEIEEGELVCSKNHTYPIKKFIPRFVNSDKYVASYSFEWGLYGKSEQDPVIVKKIFDKRVGKFPKKLENKVVLDVGCGAGKFLNIASESGAEVIGFDLSFGVDVAYKRYGKKENVHIVQADIYKPPFKSKSFDYVYCVGVLHSVPDDKKAFFSFSDLVKVGGKLSVWTYSSQNPIFVGSSKFWRFFSTKLPKRAIYVLSYLAIPLYYIKKCPIFYPLKVLIPTSEFHNFREMVLHTYNWYSPKYQHTMSYKELYEWFSSMDFRIDFIGDPVTLSGVRESSGRKN